MSAADLILPSPSEPSAAVAARVARARGLQAARYAALGFPNIATNAQAFGHLVRFHSRMSQVFSTPADDAHRCADFVREASGQTADGGEAI